jgi:hypothetical protein
MIDRHTALANGYILGERVDSLELKKIGNKWYLFLVDLWKDGIYFPSAYISTR